MAFTVTLRHTAAPTTTAAQTRTTDSVDPADDSLLLAGVGTQEEQDPTAGATIVVSGTLTWTSRVQSNWFEYGGSSAGWYQVAANISSASRGTGAAFTVTADPPSTGTFYTAIQVLEILGYDTGTPFVSGQTAIGGAEIDPPTSTGHSATLTLPGNPTSGNLVLALFAAGADTGGGFADISGWTKLQQNGAYCQTAWYYKTSTGGGDAVSLTCTDLGQAVGCWAGCIIEIAAAAGAAATSLVVPRAPVRGLTVR